MTSLSGQLKRSVTVLSSSFELELSVSDQCSVVSNQFARRADSYSPGNGGAWLVKLVDSRLITDDSRLTHDSSSQLKLMTVTDLFQLELTTRAHNSLLFV